jgi:hypothetical protein
MENGVKYQQQQLSNISLGEKRKNSSFATPIKKFFLLNGLGSPVHTGRYHQKNNLQWLKKFQAMLSCR